MFYAADSATFDTLGISHFMTDSSSNRVFALVEHFSTLVVKERVVIVSDVADSENILLVDEFQLNQNYPNPFNPATTISYQLAKASKIELAVFNMLGQKVTTLVTANQQAGVYYVNWDASGVASGVYLYRLKTDQGLVMTRKLILLK